MVLIRLTLKSTDTGFCITLVPKVCVMYTYGMYTSSDFLGIILRYVYLWKQLVANVSKDNQMWNFFFYLWYFNHCDSPAISIWVLLIFFIQKYKHLFLQWLQIFGNFCDLCNLGFILKCFYQSHQPGKKTTAAGLEVHRHNLRTTVKDAVAPACMSCLSKREPNWGAWYYTCLLCEYSTGCPTDMLTTSD